MAGRCGARLGALFSTTRSKAMAMLNEAIMVEWPQERKHRLSDPFRVPQRLAEIPAALLREVEANSAQNSNSDHRQCLRQEGRSKGDTYRAIDGHRSTGRIWRLRRNHTRCRAGPCLRRSAPKVSHTGNVGIPMVPGSAFRLARNLPTLSRSCQRR